MLQSIFGSFVFGPPRDPYYHYMHNGQFCPCCKRLYGPSAWEQQQQLYGLHNLAEFAGYRLKEPALPSDKELKAKFETLSKRIDDAVAKYA